MFRTRLGICALSALWSGIITGCLSRPIVTDEAKPIVAEAVSARGPLTPGSLSNHAVGNRIAVSTQGIAATQAARRILNEGGNIIDAAVAASFVVSVERPQSTGLGGGGFMVYREGKTGRVYAIDFRERAPVGSKPTMFMGKDGRFDPKLAQDGALAVGVPGLVAGLHEIHARFGSLPFAKIVRPAVELAEKGFAVYPELANALEARADVLRKDPGARAIFLDREGRPLTVGHILVQRDLARTLRAIASQGRDGFYKGEIANHLVHFIKTHKGLVSAMDLADYRVKWRAPLKSRFLDYDIYSMPPPSSGGVHVIQFLRFLERDHLRSKGFLSVPSIHLAASALQSAFADRALHIGDPDYVAVPVQALISPAYIAERRKGIDLGRARSAAEVAPGNPTPYESEHTTHLSLLDADGGAVSTTQTINGWMGAGVVVPGTGIVLNNEMDDFAAPDGSANMFGAVGSDANKIAPRKTPLSSMSPTLLIRDGQVRLVLGAPGGTRIISCVAQTILNWTEFRMPLTDAVSTIRYHHQWRPDELIIESPGPGAETVKRLEKMGYKVKIGPVGCKVMAVAREGDHLSAFSDPRDIGTSWAE